MPAGVARGEMGITFAARSAACAAPCLVVVVVVAVVVVRAAVPSFAGEEEPAPPPPVLLLQRPWSSNTASRSLTSKNYGHAKKRRRKIKVGVQDL